MNTEEKQAAIGLLQADMRGEHQAIVQYLLHAYAVGESAAACEIEAIARDEMRHFRWLAETIVEWGGEPTLQRDPLNLSGAAPADWMTADVGAEDTAVAQYRAHIGAITDPKTQRLLNHILADEEVHRGKFTGLAEELAAAGIVPEGSLTATASGSADAQTVDILQTGVRHEYTVILQYLYHRFMVGQCPVADKLEQQAINEMQHLGWLSEKLAGAGVKPDVEHTELALGRDPVTMLQSDIAAERAVTADYARQMEQLNDPKLKSLLAYIRAQEIYHDAVFTELMEQLRAAARPVPLGQLTVGRLLGAKQR